LIGKLSKSNRERIMVTVQELKGAKVIDFRIYNIVNDGELIPTSEGLTFTPDKVDTIVDLLREAHRKAVDGA
jgi:hypothetical protein